MDHTQQSDFIVGRDDLILITGATGFIGSAIVPELINAGHQVLERGSYFKT